ncbi:hypothetical protein Gasu2_14270 [Galdieria sulphuraria]|nr:hypothetical protein Gasu2_14270 [Galdieria sulphuraria]
MSYQTVVQNSIIASFLVLLGIFCLAPGLTFVEGTNQANEQRWHQTVTPTQTQECQRLCVTATQTQVQSCIYTSTQVPYVSQCVTAVPTTCYKYVTKYKQVCCNQEYEQQYGEQEQECTEYCQLSYQQSVSYPCQSQVSYPCQEYRLMQVQQCCQIPKVQCVQHTQVCIQKQQVQQQQQQQEEEEYLPYYQYYSY